MSGSGKWIKSLISTRKTHTSDDEDKRSEKSKKKWRLWRRDRMVASESRDYSDHAFVAAVATVVRAPPRDFMVVQREWAAIRIQTVFRGFLARQALRALKAVVRIQAIFRGRQVRKQAAVTLRCMQALVRVQARIRTRCTIMSSEGETPQKFVNEYPDKADAAENAEQRWCDSPGSMDEVRAKLQMRQEGAIKRDRALTYSRTQQIRSNSSPNVRTNKHVMSMDHQRLSKKGAARWSWLNSWMAAKPWEDRLTDEFYNDPSKTPFSMKSERHSFGTLAYSSEHSSTEVRRNNVTTKVSARPPMISQITNTSSASTSDSPYSESSGSTSSTSASSILMRSTQFVGTLENTSNQKTRYMNLTESTKAKQKAYRYGSYNMLRHRVEPLQCYTKSMDFSIGESGSITGSDPSYKVYKDLYPPIPVDGHDRLRNRRR
ncbi:calmodulin-binding family protein [Tripterygium wilfordii]|uniref:Calmodulin-binding family protein n=1 Tax=Tripterygium wilfordii TaxID=458696 RepID=A0A7J7DGL9_TRIWF|nr:protein IQ-DOMAIN 1-like isoform X2 [Tripterygium wilfordii]KAF5745525.1 calmodulin-binding family protein [Tripterygium wilfordii]